MSTKTSVIHAAGKLPTDDITVEELWSTLQQWDAIKGRLVLQNTRSTVAGPHAKILLRFMNLFSPRTVDVQY